MKFRSSEILGNVMFTENRALYKSMGWSDDDLRGPIIGIANSWNELVPGHYNLRLLADFVKKVFTAQAAAPLSLASSAPATGRRAGISA